MNALPNFFYKVVSVNLRKNSLLSAPILPTIASHFIESSQCRHSCSLGGIFVNILKYARVTAFQRGWLGPHRPAQKCKHSKSSFFPVWHARSRPTNICIATLIDSAADNMFRFVDRIPYLGSVGFFQAGSPCLNFVSRAHLNFFA